MVLIYTDQDFCGYQEEKGRNESYQGIHINYKENVQLCQL